MKTQGHNQSRMYQLALGPLAGLVLFSLGLISPLALAEDSGVVEVGFEESKVDWSNGVIRAVGLGFPSQKAKNEAHAKATAKRAARIVAYRNLLEMVEGIQVDSHSSVKNFMLESDTVNTKIQGVVRGARVTEEKALSDGSYEVTVEMNMSGSFQKAVLPPREHEPEPLKFPEQSSATTNSHTTEVVVYTGLIVDAQGLDIKQTMSPRIIMEDGRVVYGADWVDPEVTQQRTVVGYVKGIPNAKTHERVITVPLVVRALGVDAQNPSDLVISDADAQTLHLIPEHVEFLRKAKVIVVLE